MDQSGAKDFENYVLASEHEAVRNLLECPGLLVLERTLDELLGEDVELLALLLDGM